MIDIVYVEWKMPQLAARMQMAVKKLERDSSLHMHHKIENNKKCRWLLCSDFCTLAGSTIALEAAYKTESVGGRTCMEHAEDCEEQLYESDGYYIKNDRFYCDNCFYVKFGSEVLQLAASRIDEFEAFVAKRLNGE